MNENTIEGGVKDGLGKIEDQLGQGVGSEDLKARGGADQIEGHVQKAVGSAQEATGHVVEGAKAAVSKVGEQARDLYGRARERVQHVNNTVDPFVHEKPYAALAIAGAAGLLLGLLLAGRGPRIVYVEPKH